MPSVTGPSCVSRSDCCKARSTFAASLFPAASDPAAPDSRFSAAGSSAGASSASAGASSAAVSSVICGASDFASVVAVVLSSIMLAVSGAVFPVFAPKSGRRLARPITSTQHAASAAHLTHVVLTVFRSTGTSARWIRSSPTKPMARNNFSCCSRFVIRRCPPSAKMRAAVHACERAPI